MNDGFRGFPAGRVPGLVKLYSTTLQGPANSIDTGNYAIPPIYDVIDIYLLLRTDEAVNKSTTTVLFNNDSGANYARQFLDGTNATASAGTSLTDSGLLFSVPGSNVAASFFAAWKIVVPFYANTLTNKTCILTGGQDATSAGLQGVDVETITWRSLVAINAISVKAPSGKNFIAGSQVLIYGM